jgi:uncharacterized membrane protein
MKRFPPAVRNAMCGRDIAATLVPVQLDGGLWEAVLFLRLAGPECKADRRTLSRAQGPLAVGIESDVIEDPSGAVVMLRLEVHTDAGDPFAAEILLTPGCNESHFEAMRLLGGQPRLCWFFGDADAAVLHAQSHSLSEEQRRGFAEIAQDAARHDALIRCTGRYDADAALEAVRARYAPRTDAAALS